MSGACFADFGHIVTCVDKDKSKIDKLHAGIMPIYEPGLDDLVAKNVKEERLFFTVDAAETVKDADAVFTITEWDSFRALDFGRVRGAMKGNVVVDLRNICSPEDMAKHGFAYTSVGRMPPAGPLSGLPGGAAGLQ